MTMRNDDNSRPDILPALHQALDQLARVADSDPMVDPMRAVRAEARRNRNRTVALTGAAVAAVLVAVCAVGYVAWSAAGSRRAQDPGFSKVPPSSVAPTSPAPTNTEPTLALQPSDTGSADVDGDGQSDRVRLMVPAGTPNRDPADQTWLEVTTASTTETVQVSDQASYVFFNDPGLVDLDGNGASEILVFETGGGESGNTTVWTWTDGSLVLAVPADVDPPALVSATGLVSGGEDLGVATHDGRLFSWQVVRPGGHEVHVWRWSLVGTSLVATSEPGTQCISKGDLQSC